ncbi:hypothetical protein AVEN_196176-1 [Araneus ventricosus]|uniref:Myb/SANT-like DNA-binding domain-containing protein n=1 Tax=Araneus ventricosus TaxID=182803 RepID=A0A4Y2NJ22_ARAVE|nr:hypothetical protein AVEN_196176-1 [Araneus ventricosus]
MEDPGIKSVQKVKVRKWHHNEIEVLLESWKCNYHIKRQVGDKNNSLFYNAIRKDLYLHGYKRSVNEIVVKTHWLLKSYRQEKKSVLKNGCLGNFPFFFDLVDIEKMELQTESINTKSGVDRSRASDERGEEIIEEGNDPEGTQIIEENLPNDRCISDSTSQSCSVDNYSEEREPDEDVAKDTSISVNNPHLPSNDLQASTEDILLGFYEAFRKTNRQLKRNDATLLGLFKEQNEIFKTQTNLMKKLMKQY